MLPVEAKGGISFPQDDEHGRGCLQQALSGDEAIDDGRDGIKEQPGPSHVALDLGAPGLPGATRRHPRSLREGVASLARQPSTDVSASWR
jgi:hypothetical protein